MAYPIPRRNSIGSQSCESLFDTNTSPDVATNSRFMSFRQVVLPEPLRPSSISVSPRLTCRLSPANSARSVVTRYSTLRNSIVLLFDSFMPQPATHATSAFAKDYQTEHAADVPLLQRRRSSKQKGTLGCPALLNS